MKFKLFILILICTSCTNFKYKPTKVLFNVPALIGHNIDEIVTTLGKPTFYPKPPDNRISYCEYNIDEWKLSIRYYPNTKEVIDFSVYPTPVIYEYKNFEDVLRVGNLKSVAFDYVVVPGSELYASPGTYTDVTVVPKF
ncbi:MAG: hypothetical protein V5804_09085 [Mucilaginibacter sp.]|uniref:hypothetical protein n=1 Tax=Mucilaginibacter sp. TaxID=1882438 RepID=UPI0034E5E59A